MNIYSTLYVEIFLYIGTYLHENKSNVVQQVLEIINEPFGDDSQKIYISGRNIVIAMNNHISNRDFKQYTWVLKGYTLYSIKPLFKDYKYRTYWYLIKLHASMYLKTMSIYPDGQFWSRTFERLRQNVVFVLKCTTIRVVFCIFDRKSLKMK